MTYRDRILRTALLALLLYSLGCLAREYRTLRRTEALAGTLAQENAALTALRDTLTQHLAQPPDDQEMRRLAWERLGMVGPGEKVFYFMPDEAPGDAHEETDREDRLWDWKLEALWKDG